jgi:hypothetical protein
VGEDRNINQRGGVDIARAQHRPLGVGEDRNNTDPRKAGGPA